MEKIFYIVYQTINIVNHKIYIGVHQTTTLEFDGYLGNNCWNTAPSSYKNRKALLPRAIEKYGVSSFKRSTLKVFDKLEDALDLERWLVDEAFVKRPDTYNMVLGGKEIQPTNSKGVFIYDKNGNFVKEFPSQQKASLFIYGKVNQSPNISRAIKNGYFCKDYQISDIKVDFMKDYNTYKNTIWYKNVNTFKDKDGLESRFGNPKKVAQYDMDGNLIKIYKSLGECKRAGFTNAQGVIEGRRNQCKGFKFKYIED